MFKINMMVLAVFTMFLLDVVLTLFLWNYWGIDIGPNFINLEIHGLTIFLAAALEVFAAYEWAKWYVLDKESCTIIMLKRQGKEPELNAYKLQGLVSLPIIIFGMNIVFLLSGYELYFDAPYWYDYLSLLWVSSSSAAGYQFTYEQYLAPGMLFISIIALWGSIRMLRNWETKTTLTYVSIPPEEEPPTTPPRLRVVK